MFNMQYNKSEAHVAQTQHRALRSLLPGFLLCFFFFIFFLPLHTGESDIFDECSCVFGTRR